MKISLRSAKFRKNVFTVVLVEYSKLYTVVSLLACQNKNNLF